MDEVASLPLFVAPFSVPADVNGFFDHGSTADQQLTLLGTPSYGKRGHHGYDFGLRTGTPVHAMADGQVVKAGDQGPVRCGPGDRVEQNVVVRIVHDAPDGNRYATVFLHLSDVTVAEGDRVTAGQLVGHSGDTGCSSGPHLHVGVIRVTDALTGKGQAVDPYGWRGPAEDPHASRAGPSLWMWKDGQAPPLVRHTHRAPELRGTLGPLRLAGTDALDPIGGEWVEIGNQRTARRRVRTDGLVLVNDRGDRLALPDRTLAPGESLRVWTRKDAPGDGAISWGLDHEAWNDLGDCARLLDGSGEVVGALRFGPRDGCSLQ